jgi:hypothetical protein
MAKTGEKCTRAGTHDGVCAVYKHQDSARFTVGDVFTPCAKFDDVVHLAFESPPTGQNIKFTITYRNVFGFYADLEREHQYTYTVDGNAMTNEEKV